MIVVWFPIVVGLSVSILKVFLPEPSGPMFSNNNNHLISLGCSTLVIVNKQFFVMIIAYFKLNWVEVFCLIMYYLLTNIGEYFQHKALASSDSSSKSHILYKQTDFSSHTICTLRTLVLDYPSRTHA